MDKRELMDEIDRVLEISKAEDYLTLPIRRTVDILRKMHAILEWHGWLSVEEVLPAERETVLAVKQLKSGDRSMCLAYCIPEWEETDPITKEKRTRPYWVTGGNNNIIYWRPLPEMPEE